MKYIIPILFIFLLSCKHQDDDQDRITIQGEVVDFNTKTACPDTWVILKLGRGVDHFSGNIVADRVDSIITDENGLFAFSFDKENSICYDLFINKPGYLQVKSPTVLAYGLSSNQILDTIQIGSSTTVQFIVNNDNPSDNDHFQIEFPYINPSKLIYPYAYDRDMINTRGIESGGLNPDDFVYRKDFFYDFNKSIPITLKVSRNDSVTRNETTTYTLNKQEIKKIYINY